MDSRDREGGDMIDEQILLERIQRIEKTQEQILATLRTFIRELNYIQNETKPNLSVIKPTH
jgi:hypothetical protein